MVGGGVDFLAELHSKTPAAKSGDHPATAFTFGDLKIFRISESDEL